MLKSVTGAVLGAALLVSGLSESIAAPIDGMSILNQSQGASPVEQARLFCYNRYTGRFLHWGPCGGYYRPRYVYRRPRVYCRTRYTHRFLHWGYC